MTKKQAINLFNDLGKHLAQSDYTENIYVSIKGVGVKIFRSCAYYECEGYTFIWTQAESFYFNNKEVGEFLLIPHTKESMISTKTSV